MKKILIFSLLMLIPLSCTLAQPGFNARAMGLGGAYHGFARGADVSYWNPANLVLPNHPYITVDVLNFGFSIGNNSLNVGRYNDYFSQQFFDLEQFLRSYRQTTVQQQHIRFVQGKKPVTLIPIISAFLITMVSVREQ